MNKVLYISNIEVPYKARFFNKLAEEVDLTVLYERNLSSNRNQKWAKSVASSYKKSFLSGINFRNEYALSIGIFKYLEDYDTIIISCINSPIQIIAMLYLRLRRKKYILSFDGEQFIKGNGLKNRIKRKLIIGADKYLTAGEKSRESLQAIINKEKVYPYYFGPFTDEELKMNARENKNREKYVLVVGQYYPYKGLDLAVKVARQDRSIHYKFVGMGNRTELFCKELLTNDDINIEVIPFLQMEELKKEYINASVLLLPSRRECWGLVVNEAASYGLPIVSTKTSGAAIEFLQGHYDNYIFDCENIVGMYTAINEILNRNNNEYSEYLINKASKYSIERMVYSHKVALNFIETDGEK